MTPARNERGESILGAIYDDVNAALNIARRGLATLAEGAPS